MPLEDLSHLLGMLDSPVSQKALDRVDRHRFVVSPSMTFVFAGMVTHPAAHGQEGISLEDELGCLGKLALGYKGDVALAVDSSRAGAAARGSVCLFDGEGVWYRLGVGFKDSLAGSQAVLIRIINRNRAHFDAVTAGVTQLQVYVTGIPIKPNPEAARLSIQSNDLGTGEDFNVGMFIHLDQSGRDRAHSAIIGGEGLVELSHPATDTVALVAQIDLEP